MDPWDQRWLSPSGSGADAPWPDETTYETFEVSGHSQSEWSKEPSYSDDVLMSHDPELEGDEYTALNTSNTFGAGDLAPGQLMSVKVPPAWNG